MNEPVRRLLAFGLDYLVIAGYLVVLAVASVVILASPAGPAYRALWSSPMSAELLGFALLTGPVFLYFALSDSSSAAGTWGKKRLGLALSRPDGSRVGVGRALLRSAIKFLPWELAHFTVWQYAFSGQGGPPAWAPITLGLVYALVLAYLASLLFGSHRTLYDRISGSMVVIARWPADRCAAPRRARPRGRP